MAARRVLIVDDDENVALFVQAIMEGAGWETLMCHRGKPALDIAEKEQPELVILDLGLPDLSGFEVFKHLRQGPFTEKIPIIVFTGINRENHGLQYAAEDLEQAFDVERPEGFVDKPVDADFLLSTVMGVCG